MRPRLRTATVIVAAVAATTAAGAFAATHDPASKKTTLPTFKAVKAPSKSTQRYESSYERRYRDGSWKSDDSYKPGYKDDSYKPGYKDDSSRPGYKDDSSRPGYKDDSSRPGYESPDDD